MARMKHTSEIWEIDKRIEAWVTTKLFAGNAANLLI